MSLNRFGWVFFMAVFASSGFAATEVVSGTRITRILTDDNNYGGCMAGVSADLAAEGLPGCKPGYVSFNCMGAEEANTKSEGKAKFDAATLAGVTGARVTLVVTDAVKFNTDNNGLGYCLAQRIDNIF